MGKIHTSLPDYKLVKNKNPYSFLSPSVNIIMIHQMFKNMANFMIYFVIFGIAYGISTQELVLENYHTYVNSFQK